MSITSLGLAAYPVGSIYMSVSSASPASIFGGTWERITGRFLLAATDNGAAGGNSNASIAPGYTGGEATHTLTPGETATKNHSHTMNHGHGHNLGVSGDGSHSHTLYSVWQWQSSQNIQSGKSTGRHTNALTVSGGGHSHGISGGVNDFYGSTGGQTAANGSAHNNMPPYLAVYVWKRTA